MSCDSLQQQPSPLNVSFGHLPEGFCPASMQELGEAIAGRLVVTPVVAFSSFAIGSIEPTSNIGPWLKDCEEWFVWDDTLSRYVPIRKQGFNSREYRLSSGTFEVPPDIYRLRVSCWGGGGGGLLPGALGGGGGGAGAFCSSDLAVVPGQTISFVVGPGGMGGNPTTNGSDTTFLTLVAGGGLAATDASGQPGQGGTPTGGDYMINGGSGTEGFSSIGGDGGQSPQGGPGGSTNDDNIPAISNGVVPGGGGCGGNSPYQAGNGASGAVLIEY